MRKRIPRRYDDGGVGRTYTDDNVPTIFSQIGRLSGKLKETYWDSEKDCNSAHLYVLYNCPYVEQFERQFECEVRETYPWITDEQLDELKDRDFAGWLENLIRFTDTAYPQWLRDLVLGPKQKIIKAHSYFTRGYVFHTFAHGEHKSTANYGVCVKGESDFYGILQDVIEVEYPGMLQLRCVVFKCDWFDPVNGRGVRTSKFGVVDLNSGRRYNKFEPFILASQAEQVCYIPYPLVRQTNHRWLSVIKVTPRGRIIGNELPLQHDMCHSFIDVGHSTQPCPLIDPDNEQVEDLLDNSEDEQASERGETTSDDEDDEQL